MKKIIGLMVLSTTLVHASPTKWLTVDNGVLSKLNLENKSLLTEDGASVVELQANEIEKFSAKIHDKLHRCGGFITHDSYEEAAAALNVPETYSFLADYSITKQNDVAPMVSQVAEPKIRDMINALTNFHTRYYKSETGVKSSEFIRDTWAKLTAHRNDVKVELLKHEGWPQASIILTVYGSTKANEIVIIGGHADSISGWFGGNSRAPGADDNASGIATITEVIRVLMDNNYKPERTIKFMGYAAEEVGLLGSKAIANSFKSQGKQVIGVMQLDMTLNKGTEEKDIVMMSDYTNQAQNEFLGRLIDEYVKVSWGYSRCGYGCSDHASWTAAGYPASMPFESTMEDINGKIHTDKDTLQNAGGDAKHAAKFAKLALSFAVEMAK